MQRSRPLILQGDRIRRSLEDVQGRRQKRRRLSVTDSVRTSQVAKGALSEERQQHQTNVDKCESNSGKVHHCDGLSPFRDGSSSPLQLSSAATLAHAVNSVANEMLREPERVLPTTTTIFGQHPSMFSQLHLTGGPPPVYHPPRSPSSLHRPLHIPRLMGAAICCWLFSVARAWLTTTSAAPEQQPFPHILAPRRQQSPILDRELTLRQFLTHEMGFHLAMAPAFFGFYGYFGALVAWEEAVDQAIFQPERELVKSLMGASAGAMAAVLLSAGVSPKSAAQFCTTVTLGQFADWFGVGGVFRGNKFERTMYDFLRNERPQQSLLLEDSVLPVAVSAFDLQTMEGQILTKGSMARAARASATFPLLFQPVGWTEDDPIAEDYVFIDGGVTDIYGMQGLDFFLGNTPPGKRHRVINLKVGGFVFSPPGPSTVTAHGKNGTVVEVLSISFRNLPQCGPWALEKGPKTVEAARQAMIASLDAPLYRGTEEHHYELHIDTKPFW